MKYISVLGSTGSIGQNTLHVVRHHPESFRILALAAHSNVKVLEEQIREFSPEFVAVYDPDAAKKMKEKFPHLQIEIGADGLCEAAAYTKVDLVVSAISGTMGLLPTVAAIRAKKDVALANKEALVSGGAYIMKLVKELQVNLIPIDSEHSAIFQCLQGENPATISRLILTASGGPFREKTDSELQKMTSKDALNHPTWKMGPKVTIDSSTLMNKGLELIEAYWLFGVNPSQIDVVVHPQSIIHSMVEFTDRSIMAQLGETSMITPIQYAMSYPKRIPGTLQAFDITKIAHLDFYAPDLQRFRCLALATEALKAGKSFACYMNAANEVLVHRFLKEEFSWMEISEKLESMMQRHDSVVLDSLESIQEVDKMAREQAVHA
jgi:1-deoxy-D-xylulose-5-phosphate reductoisomerase